MTPAKTLTPGTLDKLFASTPREKFEGTVAVVSVRVEDETLNISSYRQPIYLT